MTKKYCGQCGQMLEDGLDVWARETEEGLINYCPGCMVTRLKSMENPVLEILGVEK